MRDATGVVVLVFTGCVWGSAFLAIQIGHGELPPFLAAGARMVLAAAVLAVVAALARRAMPKGRDLAFAAGFGFFQFGLGFGLLYWGQLSVASGAAAVIFSTIPLLTALLAFLIGIERPPRSMMAGAWIAVSGVVVLSAGELRATASPASIAAVAGAATSMAFGSVVLKRAGAIDPISVNVVATAFAAVVLLGASVVAGEPWAWPDDPRVVGSVVYLAVASSAAAFVAFAWLLARWPVSRAALATLLIPIVGVVLGATVAGEALTPWRVAGAAIVVVGLWVGLDVRGRGRGRPVRGLDGASVEERPAARDALG